MAELTKHFKKVIRYKMTSKAMELLVGLNEKNQQQIHCLAQSLSKKIVKAYFDAIKKQIKQSEKEENKKQPLITKPAVAYIEPASVAS